MQRILQRGQIESLAHRQFRRLRSPDPRHAFAKRARRLRALSSGHSLAGYLTLMADLADAQHVTASHLPMDVRAVEFAGSVLPLDPVNALEFLPWRAALANLCERLLQGTDLLSGARSTLERLVTVTHREDEWLMHQARSIVSAERADVHHGSAAFVMGAMQVCWLPLAAERIATAPAAVQAQTACPICGTAPTAALVAIDGESAGFRFLHCALCSTEWHYVRAQCSNCGSARQISYQGIEGGSAAIRAECCDECFTYCKLVYPEHDPDVDPVADDLATLTLDLLLSQAGYSRAGNNPLYWQA